MVEISLPPAKKEVKTWKRSHHCGELGSQLDGNEVTLNGWIAHSRDLGDLIFLVLRDRYGKTQILIDKSTHSSLYETAKAIKQESVVSVRGVVRKRPAEMANKSMNTGEVEVLAEELIVLNSCETLPFAITDKTEASESLRLKHRYLDLRRDSIQRNLLQRSRFSAITREVLQSHGFLDIETPFLYKSTPEGAREFLVPSRIHPGQFYALPQSPQLFKQLLMVSGFDRYYQIVKCFRDEDFRADRQPEFTQIDCELSFVEEDDIRRIFSQIVKEIVNRFFDAKIIDQIPNMTYATAMTDYGCDKPDLRFELKLIDLTSLLRESSFKPFVEALSSPDALINAIIVRQAPAELSRKRREELEKLAKQGKVSPLIWMKKGQGAGAESWESPLVKFLTKEQVAELDLKLELKEGDAVFMQAGPYEAIKASLSALRNLLGKELRLYKADQLAFTWITQFPAFEVDEESGFLKAKHHPFTSPRLEDLPLLKSDPGKVRAQAYDLVCNGYELGGGSIRIHNQELQKQIFSAIGMSLGDAEKKFGFLLEALKFGAPPHGGIAFGLDRFVMVLLGLEAIREIIPFPKTQRATCPLTEAPSPVPDHVLKDLHLALIPGEPAAPPALKFPPTPPC
ncbi:MAG: aspartate--tRNA ligase [Oligoflexales bacterium]|nr:aspartate--tRNA ligase [Oligoflexales bacterium]